MMVRFLTQRLTPCFSDYQEKFVVKSSGRKTKRILAALKAKHAIAPARLNESISYVSIDTNDAMHRIFTMKKELLRSFNLNARQLIIGEQDFAEIMNSPFPHIHQMVRFTGTLQSRYQILDLEVVIVPWMTGMVVMP